MRRCIRVRLYNTALACVYRLLVAGLPLFASACFALPPKPPREAVATERLPRLDTQARERQGASAGCTSSCFLGTQMSRAVR